MEPGKVTAKNAHQIRERLYGNDDHVLPCKLMTGDKVRIPRIKNIHAKGYAQSKYTKYKIWCYLTFRLDRYDLYDCECSSKFRHLLFYFEKSRRGYFRPYILL